MQTFKVLRFYKKLVSSILRKFRSNFYPNPKPNPKSNLRWLSMSQVDKDYSNKHKAPLQATVQCRISHQAWLRSAAAKPKHPVQRDGAAGTHGGLCPSHDATRSADLILSSTFLPGTGCRPQTWAPLPKH